MKNENELTDVEVLRLAISNIKNGLTDRAWRVCSDAYFKALEALERIESRERQKGAWPMKINELRLAFKKIKESPSMVDSDGNIRLPARTCECQHSILEHDLLVGMCEICECGEFKDR